jgi:hypothetical protein
VASIKPLQLGEETNAIMCEHGAKRPKPHIALGKQLPEPKLDVLFGRLDDSTLELKQVMCQYAKEQTRLHCKLDEASGHSLRLPEKIAQIKELLAAARRQVIDFLQHSSTPQENEDDNNAIWRDICSLRAIAVGLVEDFGNLHARLGLVLRQLQGLLCNLKEIKSSMGDADYPPYDVTTDMSAVRVLFARTSQLQVLNSLQRLAQVTAPLDCGNDPSPSFELSSKLLLQIQAQVSEKQRRHRDAISRLCGHIRQLGRASNQNMLVLQNELSSFREELIQKNAYEREQERQMHILQCQNQDLLRELDELRARQQSAHQQVDDKALVGEGVSEIQSTASLTLGHVVSKPRPPKGDVVLAFAGFSHNLPLQRKLKSRTEALGMSTLMDASHFSPRITHLMRPSAEYVSARVLAAFLSCKCVVMPDWLDDAAGQGDPGGRKHQQSPMRGKAYWYDPQKLILARLHPKMDHTTLQNLIVELGRARKLQTCPILDADSVEIVPDPRHIRSDQNAASNDKMVTWSELIEQITNPPNAR